MAAGVLLKSLYPKLFHTCVTQSLHHSAIKVKFHFEDLDQLITKAKSATCKNKTRQAKFATIGCPLWPVVTRWESLLNATWYYTKNLLEVKGIVESFEGSDMLETQAKVRLQTIGLATQLLKIKDQYECLIKLIETESAKYTIKEANQAIKKLKFGENTCSIKE